MSNTYDAPQPQRAAPQRVTPGHAGAFSLGALAIALIAGMLWLSSADSRVAPAFVPMQLADLGPGLVTPVDPDNHAAVAAAVSTLRLPQAQRAELRQAVVDRERQLGWIVFTDSMEDGDTVAVEAGGLVQNVVLTKAWMPVAVPIDAGPIGITGLRDGGGGIRVALGTRSGAVMVRVLAPGERVEIPAP